MIWKLERDRERTPPPDAPLLTPDIRSIAVAGPGVPQPYTLERYQIGEWRITSPFTWKADAPAVDKILEQLRFLQLDGSFTVAEAEASGSTLANYGLEKPDAHITVRGDNAKSVVLHLGRLVSDSAAGPVYLLAPGGHIIPLATTESQKLLSSLYVTPDDLRANTIFTMDAFEVRGITVRITGDGTAPEQHIRIKRDQRPIPDQNDTELIWRFEAPVNADASRPFVEEWLNKLTQLRYMRFLDSTPDRLQQTGLNNPVMRLSIEGNNRLQTLLVGARAPDSAVPAYYAKLEDNRAMFIVRESEIKNWRDALTMLREREFFHFYPSFLTEITVRDGDGKSLVFHRRSTDTAPAGTQVPNSADLGDWTIPVLPGSEASVTLAADPAVMRTLINALLHLNAQETSDAAILPEAQRRLSEAIVTDTPTDEQLAALGFNKPARRVELNFKNAPRRILLLAAPVAAGTPWHAKLADHPAVYSIRPDILDLLSVSPAQYRNRTVFQLPDGAFIAGVKLTDLATGKTLLDSARIAPDAPWNGIAEAGKLQRLAGQLAIVRAAQYASDVFSPEYTIRYLGAEVPEGWRYRLDATLRLPNVATPEVRTLFFTKRLAGTTQIAGSPAQACVFHLEQSFIDALFALTFEVDPSKDIPRITQPAALPPPPVRATPLPAASAPPPAPARVAPLTPAPQPARTAPPPAAPPPQQTVQRAPGR
jgi:hypothetical protein